MSSQPRYADLSPGLSIRPFDARVGAEVHGLDLREPVSNEIFAALEEALHQFGVLAIRDQRIDDAQQKSFSRRFGSELDIHPLRQFGKPDNPEVFVLSNIKVNGEPIGASDAAQYWHSDLSYTEHPSRVSILYAVEVPQDENGPLGDTEFASTRQAWLDLPEELKRKLTGLKAFHHARKPKKSQSSHFTKTLTSDVEQQLALVSHPVVRKHPFTGEPCLFVNEGFTTSINGMDGGESESLLQYLYDHMTQRKYVYVHKWRVGDVVVWDNCLTIHQGIPSYGPHQRRLMFRTIVKGPSTS